MTPFLSSVSEYIYNKHAEELGNICIVLPNRRAKLFIQKHLSSIINKTVFSPEIYAIEDFILKLSGYRIADNLQMIFELYATHKSLNAADKEKFEDFLNWGQMLLHDFNDIDLYMVKPSEIFNYLNDAKNISHWNPDGEEPTENQKNYLKFYSSFLDYYNLFTEKLIQKKEVYNGLAYRKVAENIHEINKSISWEKIYFVGLNAMTISEEQIIRYLIDVNKAEILWDSDKYYMDNHYQESGVFLRHYRSAWELKKFNWVFDNYSEKKNINVIGVPKQIGQVKYAGQILKNIAEQNKENISNTAVVLADENLLLPLLNSIPDNINKFNVTMGLPLKLVPLFDLYNTLFVLHENASKLNRKDADGNICFYFNDILKFLEHPYILKYAADQKSGIYELIRKLQSTRKVFYSYKDIKANFENYSADIINPIIAAFISWKDNTNLALDYLCDITEILKQSIYSLDDEDDKQKSHINLEAEYLFAFEKIFKRLQSLSATFKNLNSVKALHILFNQIVSSSSLPFYGEPLNGLQIMGVLETRTLDFENVIMLSVNENLLPSAKTNNSFIPFDIRKKFKLPTYHDRDSIFAYHFYRLLQRAKNISLIYNTENDEFGKGEKSRFITQLQNELEAYNPDITIKNQILNIPPSKDDIIKAIIIDKTDDIIETLKLKAIKGFSPSSLNKFRNCSLQFYFSDVIGLKETEEVEETIEASTLGTVIHHVLFKLYELYKGQKISKEILSLMLPKIEASIEKAFKDFYTEGDITSGKNLLIVKVANKFITNFIKSESADIAKNNTEIFIKNLEEFFTYELPLNDKNHKILLKGKFDRIDEVNGTVRIVDYKTGAIKANELNIKDWELLADEPGLDKSFQLLMYAWLYFKNNPQISTLKPGLISLRQISKGLQSISYPDKTDIFNKEVSQQTEAIIVKLISDIFNPGLQFVQTENLESCKYCAFKNICIR